MTDIRIINFGLDSQFTNTERLIKSLEKSFKYDSKSRANQFNIQYRRALSDTKLATLLSDISFFGHVMAHGTKDGKLHGLFGLLQADISNFSCLDEDMSILNMDGLLLDACQTFSRTWIRKITQSLPTGKSLVLIGTNCDVGWDEAAIYVSSFYSTLLQTQIGESKKSRTKALFRSHDNARRTVEKSLAIECSFKVAQLGK